MENDKFVDLNDMGTKL